MRTKSSNIAYFSFIPFIVLIGILVITASTYPGCGSSQTGKTIRDVAKSAVVIAGMGCRVIKVIPFETPAILKARQLCAAWDGSEEGALDVVGAIAECDEELQTESLRQALDRQSYRPQISLPLPQSIE